MTVFHATPQCSRPEDALETPNVPIEQPIDQSLCGEVSMLVMQGAVQGIASTGKKTNVPTRAMTGAQAPR